MVDNENKETGLTETALKSPMSQKRKKGELIKQVRELANPERLRIPHKNPTLNYRWIRNTPDNIELMEAKGYRVASADIVRAAGLKPGVDGTCRKGDLVLAIEEMRHHKTHRDAEAELRNRQKASMRQGVKRPARAGGFEFSETVRQE
jgi:hypothetical protein